MSLMIISHLVSDLPNREMPTMPKKKPILAKSALDFKTLRSLTVHAMHFLESPLM